MEKLEKVIDDFFLYQNGVNQYENFTISSREFFIVTNNEVEICLVWLGHDKTIMFDTTNYSDLMIKEIQNMFLEFLMSLDFDIKVMFYKNEGGNQ